MEALNDQLFSLKGTLKSKQKRIEEVEREENEWRVRAKPLRDDSELENDHARISKLVTVAKTSLDKKMDDSHRYYVHSAFSNSPKNMEPSKVNSSIARAESTPPSVPVTKRVLDLMNLKEDIEVKKRINRSLRKQP